MSLVRSWIRAFVKGAIQIPFPYDASKMSVASLKFLSKLSSGELEKVKQKRERERDSQNESGSRFYAYFKSDKPDMLLIKHTRILLLTSQFVPFLAGITC